MSDASSVLLRIRDVAFALRSAHDHGLASVTRIQLQKLVYLVDTVAYLYLMLPPTQRHRTYKHGPYDHYIQNAADTLAFRGLVSIDSLREFPSGQVATSYSLTPAGTKFTQGLVPQFDTRWQATNDVAVRISRIGWQHIVSLVYAEPTFVAARGRAFSQPLRTDDVREDSTKRLLMVFVEAVTSGFDVTSVPIDVILDGFFDYLWSVASKSKTEAVVTDAEAADRT